MTNVRVTLSLLAVILAFAKSAPGQSNWSVFTAQPHGFSIELPGTPQEEPGKPGQFILQSGGFTFIAEASELESSVFQLVASRDRKNIAMMLEAMRDASAKGMNATVRDSSSADVDGQPALSYWLEFERKGTALSRSCIGLSTLSWSRER